MNAPLLFILTPLAAAVASFFFFPLRPRSVILMATALAAGLAWTAATIPLDAPLVLFHFPIPVTGTLFLLGRQFIALFGGTLAIAPNRFFLPGGWIVLSLFSASLFVQPFLYAAFFLFLSVLVLSLLLSDPSHPVPRGSIRWIAYSSLGMLFLLLAGSKLPRFEDIPSSPEDVESLFVQLSLGFGLLLSFPPFHFWLPDVVDDSPPYAVSFILSLYIGAVVFFLLRFLDGFSWLRLSPETYLVLKVGGVGMCLVGGFFSVFQNRLGRCIGYLSLCNLGMILLSLSVPGPVGAQTTMVLLAARGFSLLVWGVSFHALRTKHAEDNPTALRGVAAQRPLAFSAAMISALSLVGAPGLMSFPPLWAVLHSLSRSADAGFPPFIPPAALLLSLVAGVLSFLRFARPMLHLTVAAPAATAEKSRSVRLFLLGSIVCLFLLGIFPQLYFPWVANSANAFKNIMGVP
jgi:formate hydrogenlyase subunit 3/multisubunit Na+/H+ antiporter MnhD subunit